MLPLDVNPPIVKMESSDRENWISSLENLDSGRCNFRFVQFFKPLFAA